MLGDNFRPWGEIQWVFSKLPQLKWDIIGCISTEDRFIGTLTFLAQENFIDRVSYWQIFDPPSRDSKIIKEKMDVNCKNFFSLGRKKNEIQDFLLFDLHNKIISSINEFLSKTNGNIILDITCFPKKFFFPILKILKTFKLKNLIITYSSPEKYSSEELSSNPDSWGHLPLFGPSNFPESPVDIAIVGVGFMPFGLPQLLLSNYSSIPVKFLFPFPPGPPNYQRTWNFVREIEESYTLKPVDDIIRVNANNLPDAFEHITQLSDGGKKNLIFAPYGPKPFSLAMALFAIKYPSVVYYTQPHHYNPNYSIGLSQTFAYCIVLNEINLY